MALAADRRPWPRRWSRRWAWLIGGGVVLAAGVATGIVVEVTATHTVTLTEKSCGANWSGPVPGHQEFTLHDAAENPVEVYLIDPRRNLVYAEARNLTPDTDRAVETTLGTGQYALRCVFTDGTVITSAAHSLTATVAGAVPGVPPMPDLDLSDPVTAYRGYVQANLPPLLRDATRLAADLTAGNLAAENLTAARTDWLTAHLDYERLGAAYNTFEDFDADLNGTADGLPKGVTDPSWTGFFRIEYGLWHGQPASQLRPLTAGLVTDIRALIQDFPSEDTDPGDLPLRSHEILENALEFQVTGTDDYGSGSSLATVYANTQGTKAVLGTLTALISSRNPTLLTAINQAMFTVQTELLGARVGGSWTPVGRLPTPQRQRLDGDLGALLEQLAVIPNLLQERTSA